MVKYLLHDFQMERNKINHRSKEPHPRMRCRDEAGFWDQYRRANNFSREKSKIHETHRTSVWNFDEIRDFAENDNGSRRPT